MWPPRTKLLLSKLGIRLPIIQAPMGGITTPRLVAAVSNAGGLGSLAGGYLSPQEIRKAIRDTRSLTKYPFNVNLFVPKLVDLSPEKINKSKLILNAYRIALGIPLVEPTESAAISFESFDEQLKVLLEEKVPIVSFTFGIPSSEFIKKLKDNGTIVIGTATTVKEGLALEASQCDAIVAQGSEAGGHRGTFNGPTKTSLIGTMALIPQMVDRVKIPIIAAGGIMDGRGFAASLILEASAVQMGTAFLTCSENGIHEEYKKAVLRSTEESTVVTSAFTGKPARAIKNEFIEGMTKHEDSLPDYPIQHKLTLDIRKEAAKQNRPEFMFLLAGQGTRLNTNKTASDLVTSVAEEALKILSGSLETSGVRTRQTTK